MSSTEVPRIVVADDSALWRELIVGALRESGFDVVGEASDLPETLRVVEHLKPDVAVLDVRMPPTGTNEGVEAARTIRTGPHGTAVLLLSNHIETSTAAKLLEECEGKVGYLLKDRVTNIDELVSAIRRVVAGEVVLDPEVVSRLFGRKRRNDPLDRLTPTQRDVLALIAEGRSNKGIAEVMFISERTVETHVSAIFDALGLGRAPEIHRRVLAAITLLRSAE